MKTIELGKTAPEGGFSSWFGGFTSAYKTEADRYALALDVAHDKMQDVYATRKLLAYFWGVPDFRLRHVADFVYGLNVAVPKNKGTTITALTSEGAHLPSNEQTPVLLQTGVINGPTVAYLFKPSVITTAQGIEELHVEHRVRVPVEKLQSLKRSPEDAQLYATRSYAKQAWLTAASDTVLVDRDAGHRTVVNEANFRIISFGNEALQTAVARLALGDERAHANVGLIQSKGDFATADFIPQLDRIFAVNPDVMF